MVLLECTVGGRRGRDRINTNKVRSYQSINQLINQSINQSIKQASKQAITQ